MALHTEPKFPQFGRVFCCLTQQNPDCSAAQYHIPLYFRFMLLHMSPRVFVFWASMSLDDWACIFQSWISFASLGLYLSAFSSMVGWEAGDVPFCIYKHTSPSIAIICIFYRQGCLALKFLSVQTQCKHNQPRQAASCSIMAVKYYSTPSPTSLTISSAHILSTSFRSSNST